MAATISGTAADEELVSTGSADTISAKGGDDVVRGLRGEDKIRGGRGSDFLYSEDIFSQSGAFRDVVDCGPGNDRASVDFRDRVVDCEEVGEAIP